jgi:hypothetical protein
LAIAWREGRILGFFAGERGLSETRTQNACELNLAKTLVKRFWEKCCFLSKTENLYKSTKSFSNQLKSTFPQPKNKFVHKRGLIFKVLHSFHKVFHRKRVEKPRLFHNFCGKAC